MNFHEARIDLLRYILNKGPKYLKMIEKRNAYDKLIRNYHQSSSEGLQLYGNKRAKGQLVHSIDALAIIEKHKRFKEAQKNLWYEHSVPIKIIRNKLEQLAIEAEKKSFEIKDQDVKQILDCTSLVVITKKERDKIDHPRKGFKDKMPTSEWPPKNLYARFQHENVNIELEINYPKKLL